MKKYIDYLSVDFGVNQIGDFKIQRDGKTDAIYWTNGAINIWASPGFDGDEEIVDLQLEYYDENGDVHTSDGEMFYLKNEGDLLAQKVRYLSVIEAIVREVDRMEFYTHYYEEMNSVLDNNFWKKFN
jgi:hypothetical protein